MRCVAGPLPTAIMSWNSRSSRLRNAAPNRNVTTAPKKMPNVCRELMASDISPQL